MARLMAVLTILFITSACQYQRSVGTTTASDGRDTTVYETVDLLNKRGWSFSEYMWRKD